MMHTPALSTRIAEPEPPRRRLLGMLAKAGAGSLLLPALPRIADAAPVANQVGLTGLWFDPATSGQGMMIEVYPDLLGPGIGFMFGGWFTYDTVAGGTSSQRWYSFAGEIRDATSAVNLVVYRNTGGRFVRGPVTFAEGVGRATMRFASCTAATFEFQLDDGRNGSIALARGLDNVVCADAGSAGNVDFAYSGTWYDPSTSGQGLVLEFNPRTAVAFFGWYTYADIESPAADPAQQRWFTAQAVVAAGDRSLSFILYSSTGGRFATGGGVNTVPVGTAEISFLSCNAAVFNYRFVSGEMAGRSGTINLSRVGVAPGACAFGSTCVLTPSETEGPYPLLAALSDTTLRRSDLTEGRPGVPLTLILKLVDVSRGCAPIVGAAIYAWHCDKDGVYSGYPNQTGRVDATGQTFMRGVQTTNAAGQVVFQTIYPGWYSGRITHVHFRAWLGGGTNGSGIITSQVAFPQDVTQAVYASTLYAARGQNTSVTSFAADNVFRDGVSFQLANVAGTPSTGYVATLIVGVAG